MLGRAIAFGHAKSDETITPEFVTGAKYMIDFAGKQYPARARLEPPFDPKNAKIMV